MKTVKQKSTIFITLIFLLISWGQKATANVTESDNNTILLYFGGDIITMEGEQAEYAEAVVQKDGEIAFVGTLAGAELQFPKANKKNLKGKTMLPGFIDIHSHFSQTATKLGLIGLDPKPAGDITSIEDIIKKLKTELAENSGQYQSEKEWLIGWGFDNGMLAENRFPTREDLDKISTEFPIAIIHFSGHMLVLNSKGLERSGYLKSDYEIPEGGVLGYKEGSKEPNGIIEEQAMLTAFSKIGEDATGQAGVYAGVPIPEEKMMALYVEAQKLYASEGFTTITDMATTDEVYNQISRLGDNDQLLTDVGMAYFSSLTTVENVKKRYAPDYNNHYRVIGGKLNLDGGSPGRTAYLRAPYYTPTPGQGADYRGYSSINKQEDMNTLVSSYYKEKIPFFIHALGDAALDQCIAAVTYSKQENGYDDARTNLIHLQLVQPDQFKALKNLDVTLTFQIAHNFYFADFHNQYIYGPERTRRLNPMKEALDHGFSTTFHHDSPVHPVDQIFLIWIATNRESRSGKIYGPENRLTPYEALYAATMAGAYQLKEEHIKGSIEVSKLADFVILDKNPLKIEKEEIKDLQVIETIKKGKSIFKQ